VVAIVIGCARPTMPVGQRQRSCALAAVLDEDCYELLEAIESQDDAGSIEEGRRSC